jgi:hypothetical protein
VADTFAEGVLVGGVEPPGPDGAAQPIASDVANTGNPIRVTFII